MTAAPQITSIPFNKLVISESNMRQSPRKEGIDELAANIAVKGVIKPLIVRPTDGEKFEVIDGGRRLLAVGVLVKQKVHPRSYPVPVVVRNEDDTEALDTSLAANDFSVPPHAVDRYETFARLIDQGFSEPEIATRYGLQARQVKQALALGKLAPQLRDAWRRGKIDAPAAQAFTIHQSHDVQVAAFDKLRKGGKGALSEHNIRHELAGDQPAKDDVAAPLLALYEAAGGKVKEDLFAEESYIEDGALLRKVTRDWQAEQEAAKRVALLGQGWAWVARADALPKEWRWDWGRLHPERKFSEADEAKRNDLETKADNATTDAEQARFEAEIAALEDAMEMANFTKEMRARSGVVIEFQNDGSMDLAYGMLRPSDDGTVDLESAIDAKAALDDEEADEHEESEEDEASAAPTADISMALLQSLSEVRTIAASRTLAANPNLAMRVITAALVARGSSPAAVANSGHPTVRGTYDDSSFAEVFKAALSRKNSVADLAFAAAVASTLDLTADTWRYRGDHDSVDALVAALPADQFHAEALEVFNPTDYFKRVTKDTCLAAIGEIREAGAAVGLAPEDVLADMKKTELANAAAAQATICGWLPPQLRSAAYALKVTEAA